MEPTELNRDKRKNILQAYNMKNVWVFLCWLILLLYSAFKKKKKKKVKWEVC